MEKIIDIPTRVNGKSKQSYRIWKGILRRVYKPKDKDKSNYKDCVVCSEWMTYSNFDRWYTNNSVEGYQIDKDILVPGNKIYGPEYCCFVPNIINSLFAKRSPTNSIVVGVQLVKDTVYKQNYVAVMNDGIRKKLIFKRFDSEKEAYDCYVMIKGKYLKEVAELYKNTIDPRVYEALYSYKFDTYENVKRYHISLFPQK